MGEKNEPQEVREMKEAAEKFRSTVVKTARESARGLSVLKRPAAPAPVEREDTPTVPIATKKPA